MGKNPTKDDEDTNPYDWKTYMTALELIKKIISDVPDLNLKAKAQNGQLLVVNPEGDDIVIWTGI